MGRYPNRISRPSGLNWRSEIGGDDPDVGSLLSGGDEGDPFAVGAPDGGDVQLITVGQLPTATASGTAEPEVGQIAVVLGVETLQGVDDSATVGGDRRIFGEPHLEQIVSAQLPGFRHGNPLYLNRDRGFRG